METLKIEHRKILVNEYQNLRATTGWSQVENDVVQNALERELFSVVCTEADANTVVGMGRVIGDGAIYFYIQDVVVHPNYKRRGVGGRIMNEIESFLKKNANNNSFVGLMAADSVSEFYHRFRYLERPHNKPGMFKIMTKL